MLLRPLQPMNASSPIVFSKLPSSNITFWRFFQSTKALLCIATTLFGMKMLSCSPSSNYFSLITLVPSGTTNACGSSSICFFISSDDCCFPPTLFALSRRFIFYQRISALFRASLCYARLVSNAICVSCSLLCFCSNCLLHSCSCAFDVLAI